MNLVYGTSCKIDCLFNQTQFNRVNALLNEKVIKTKVVNLRQLGLVQGGCLHTVSSPNIINFYNDLFSICLTRSYFNQTKMKLSITMSCVIEGFDYQQVIDRFIDFFDGLL